MQIGEALVQFRVENNKRVVADVILDGRTAWKGLSVNGLKDVMEQVHNGTQHQVNAVQKHFGNLL